MQQIKVDSQAENGALLARGQQHSDFSAVGLGSLGEINLSPPPSFCPLDRGVATWAALVNEARPVKSWDRGCKTTRWTLFKAQKHRGRTTLWCRDGLGSVLSVGDASRGLGGVGPGPRLCMENRSRWVTVCEQVAAPGKSRVWPERQPLPSIPAFRPFHSC